MTINNSDMDRIFRKAAAAALYAWRQDESGLEDLVGDLWVWYLERPMTQEKLSAIKPHECVKSVKAAALQMLSKRQLSSNKFNGRNLYSSDSVKDALKGVSTNRYLVDILPRAMESLGNSNPGQAEAVRSRYEDGEVPEQGKHYKLVKALKSLTEHVNVIAITAGVDADGNVSEGPGSRHAIFPETRGSRGYGHADPTGDTAILLMEHPELRDEYLEELPLREFLGGRGYAQSA